MSDEDAPTALRPALDGIEASLDSIGESLAKLVTVLEGIEGSVQALQRLLDKLQ